MARDKHTKQADLLIEALDRTMDALGFDGDHQVRVIERADGREIVLVQANAFSVSRLYVTGRPDGKKIGEFDSWFEKIQARLEQHRKEHGTDFGMRIERDEWTALYAEARDRYVRYLFFSGIQRWEDVERDTFQNITVCDWARRYAEEDTAWDVYQYKGYILMMNAIARAELALEEDDLDAAERHIQQGLDSIGAYCRECVKDGHEDAEQVTREHYLANMIKYRDELVMDGRLPNAGRDDPRNVV
ncbi:MAG: DNA helicase UvrBC [Candidatus Poribacteria bacterium]|nr:DNA helicase UvrBC [Candidatus Poribacteria bacterium]